jgi:hypothetical protein
MNYIPADKKQAGMCGVELEVELSNLRRDVIPYEGWRSERDGSLRGDSYEFVMKAPLAFDEAKQSVTDMFNNIKLNGATIKDTGRAGTHVHLNVQEFSIPQLFILICCYLIVEELITEKCGKYRQGNLFCLRAKDASYIVDFLERNMMYDNPITRFNTDKIRYSAMNLKAVPQYGSLEFRAMGTITALEPVLYWIGLLEDLHNAVKLFDSPLEIYESFSMDGEEVFLEKVFGSKARDLMRSKGWKDKLKGGIRLSQSLAYTTDWNRFEEEQPVQRDLKRDFFEEHPPAPRPPAPKARRLVPKFIGDDVKWELG